MNLKIQRTAAQSLQPHEIFNFSLKIWFASIGILDVTLEDGSSPVGRKRVPDKSFTLFVGSTPKLGRAHRVFFVTARHEARRRRGV